MHYKLDGAVVCALIELYDEGFMPAPIAASTPFDSKNKINLVRGLEQLRGLITRQEELSSHHNHLIFKEAEIVHIIGSRG